MEGSSLVGEPIVYQTGRETIKLRVTSPCSDRGEFDSRWRRFLLSTADQPGFNYLKLRLLHGNPCCSQSHGNPQCPHIGGKKKKFTIYRIEMIPNNVVAVEFNLVSGIFRGNIFAVLFTLWSFFILVIFAAI